MQTNIDAAGQVPAKTVRSAILEARPWERACISRSCVYDLIASGDFPRPVKIGRASRWVVAEVDAWIGDRMAARPAEADA